MPRGLLIVVLLVASGCCTRPCCTVPGRPVPRWAAALFEQLPAPDARSEEQRYAAIRADRPGECGHIGLVLLAAGDESPMVRNAAARALIERGDESAASFLITNLHRDQRTYVVTDAIHHLREVFGTDRGYEPNKGYRHQTERRDAWIAWFREEHSVYEGQFYVSMDEARPAASDAERADVRRALEALRDTDEEEDEDAQLEDAALMALWKLAADTLASSRHPDDVRLLADVFGEMASRRGRVPAFWNNYALALLNDGRFELAEAAYRRALELTPDDPQLHNDIGILHEGMERLDEAEAAYRESLRLRPDDDVAQANLGDVLMKQGRRKEAIAAWRRAETLAPEKWQYHRLWIRRAQR